MKYGVRLVGENYEVLLEGQHQLLGFYTTRFVKAASPEEAEIKAVDLVRRDSQLNEIMVSEPQQSATLSVDEMWRESWWKRLGGKGYSFFDMCSDHEEN